MKNIYDLEGNFYEWTQEAYNTSYRTSRGGSYGYASGSYWYPASYWSFYTPAGTSGFASSRPALYVTL